MRREWTFRRGTHEGDASFWYENQFLRLRQNFTSMVCLVSISRMDGAWFQLRFKLATGMIAMIF